MYSQCPDCLTRFRVTAEVLRAAHGTVRCGRCGAAFDALARLSDTLPPVGRATPDVRMATVEPSPAMAAAASPATQASEFHFSADDLEKVFVDARDWQRQFGPEAVESSDAVEGDAEPPQLVVDESESLEDITLEGEQIRIDHLEEFAELREALDREGDAQAEGHGLVAGDRFPLPAEADDAPAFDDEPAGGGGAAALEALPIAAPEPTVTARTAAEDRADLGTVVPNRWRVAEAEAEAAEVLEEAPASGHALAWTLGSLLLAFALAAQLVHHYRQELVRHPQVGPSLLAVYGALGLPLAPNWDPRAFDLRQWGSNEASPAAGRLSVRASITNRAGFAQPLPLLRLDIEDRFGGTVATRDFKPGEYLKDPALATRMLAPGASVEANLEIVDPGADAVGFRLDTCLPESPTLLRCAQGSG